MQNHTRARSEVGTAEPANDKVVRLSILVACASVLQVAESLLPHPLPGVRLGMANIITLIAMVYIGPGSAVQLAVLRTLVSSMVMGTFLTPTFVLSFSGGVASALVMVLLYRLSRGVGPFRFSLIGISVGGAASHILTQVVLVYLLFIRSSGVLLLWPWLAFSAVVTGIVTGMIAVQAVRRLESKEAGGLIPVLVSASNRADTSDQSDKDSAARRLRPEVKIAAVVVLGLAVVIFSNYVLYLAVFALLVVLAAVARVRPSQLISGLKRLWVLLLAALVTPVVFSPWGRLLLGVGPLRVTDQGLHEGAIFATRILLLFFATALLSQTTRPHDVAGGLEKLLAPLRVFRVKPGQLAQSLSLSWFYFPQFWQSVRRMVSQDRGRKGWFDRTIHLPGDVVADLYFAANELAEAVSPEQPASGGFPPPADRG